MNSERWQEVERIFGLAVEAEPSERASLIARESGDDEELAREVRQLVEADGGSGDVLGVVSAVVDDLVAHGDTDAVSGQSLVRLASSQDTQLEELGLALGQVVDDRYVLERVLGAGGMGVVVEALHVVLDERVALKLLKPSVVSSKRMRERFVREARAAAKVKSDHIARVRDVGILEGGAPYMVMDLLVGVDLAQVLKAGDGIPAREAVTLTLQACEALAVAHERGIVHRDVKPANLFLERSPGGVTLKLLDFGVSKQLAADEDETLTGSADLVGSPAYMSPEQLRRARDVDARADIWSLGVVLYELLGGKRPFVADTVADLLMDILTTPTPPLPDHLALPSGLVAVVNRCLAKQRTERFDSARSLAKALAPFALDAPHDEASAVVANIAHAESTTLQEAPAAEAPAAEAPVAEAPAAEAPAAEAPAAEAPAVSAAAVSGERHEPREAALSIGGGVSSEHEPRAQKPSGVRWLALAALGASVLALGVVLGRQQQPAARTSGTAVSDRPSVEALVVPATPSGRGTSRHEASVTPRAPTTSSTSSTSSTLPTTAAPAGEKTAAPAATRKPPAPRPGPRPTPVSPPAPTRDPYATPH